MTIPYGRQNISDADIDAVAEVLRSEFLTQGPCVPKFEELVARTCDVGYAVATNSATSALHLACLALGVGSGDRVWTSAITFVASANCAKYCGASVDFVDIDPATYTMSVSHLEQKLEEASRIGLLPKVVIPVHLAGQSCDMKSISGLASKYGFYVLEDASHAIGASYKGFPVGSCEYSSIAVFSFHPVKIVTTGEGGVATTNDPSLAEKMAMLRSHGIIRDPQKMNERPHGPWYYQQVELGFNYRLTDIAGALGSSQMVNLSRFVEERHEIARRYDDMLEGLPVVTPWQHPEARSSFHLYIIRLDQTVRGFSQKESFERMRANGVSVNLHYMPVYRHPYYASLGYRRGDYPESERYYSEAMSLPIYPGLSEAQQSEVVRVLNRPSGFQTIF